MVGYPIDFDTASTIEGKESQVSRMCDVCVRLKTLNAHQYYLHSYMYHLCIYLHEYRLSPSAWRKTKSYEPNQEL